MNRKLVGTPFALCAVAFVCGLQICIHSSAYGRAPQAQRRPQEERIARGPLPYPEQFVAFNSVAGVRLAGTLTLPRGVGPYPGIVLISGSGPNSRDEVLSGHKLGLVLADALTRSGCAVLRYDKRGVNKSTGDYDRSTTADAEVDAAAAVTYLRSRSEVMSTRVGLVGHSEGGTVAAWVAAKDSGIAFIVMLAGYSIPGKVLVAEQNRRIAIAGGQDPVSVNQAYALNRLLYDAIGAAKNQKDAQSRVRHIIATSEFKPDKDQVDQAILFTTLPSMRFVLAFDPTESLDRIHVPVLAFYGSKDLIVPADLDIPVLREALARDADVTITEIPNLNHLFQQAQTGLPQEFGEIEETISPEVLDMVSAWVTRHIP